MSSSAFHVGVTTSLANNPRVFFFNSPTSQRASPDSIFSVCIQSIPRIHAPAGNDGRWKNTEKHEFQGWNGLNFGCQHGYIFSQQWTKTCNNIWKQAPSFFLCNAHWLWLLGPLFVPSGVLCCLWTPWDLFQIFPNLMGTLKGLAKTAQVFPQVFPHSYYRIRVN